MKPACRSLLPSIFLSFFSAALLPAAETALTGEARAAMGRATSFMRSLATEGGYLWRYSPDLRERAGEIAATPTQIWVQPPGTPAIGAAFLRAHEVTGDPAYLEAAKRAADALVAGQLESGGWDYLVEFDPALRAGWYWRSDVGRISQAEVVKRKNTSTFDDDNTQSALRFLMAVADADKAASTPRDERIREARDYGLAKLMAAQHPHGGWPQRWDGTPADPKNYATGRASIPPDWPREHQRQPYYQHATLNDQTHRDCVMTLLEAAKRLGRPEYRAAALKGGEFLLRAQLPEPQPAWAQQYNAQLEPTWARAFEPPSVCSSESAGAMLLLVDLYLETGDEKYLKPLPAAIDWLKRSEIAAGQWARLYELGTNRPIFGDRDGKIYYRVEDISLERQNGYSWKGAFRVPHAIAYFNEVSRTGRTAFLARRDAKPTAAQRAAQAKTLEPRVREAIAALDAQGRWIADYRGAPQIRTETFIGHVRLLCDYLEAAK